MERDERVETLKQLWEELFLFFNLKLLFLICNLAKLIKRLFGGKDGTWNPMTKTNSLAFSLTPVGAHFTF